VRQATAEIQVTDAAIIEAEYVEWKMVKTRKSLQLIFEVPLEAQERVMTALGIPMPDTSTPVAICRLNPAMLAQRVSEPEPEAHQLEGPASGDDDKPARPLSQVSAYLCTIVAFRRFLWEEYKLESMPTEDQAADFVRSHCGVQSRREFDLIESAAANFRDLRWRYNAWLRVPA
jgi:hypothetical protein